MMTIKIYPEDNVFKNIDDAIKYMESTNYERDVSVYDINTIRAYHKVQEIYTFIKEYNKGKLLDDQILPTNPHAFRGIVGCLGVQVYSIGLGTYKRNHECIALFSGWYDDVLDTSIENACIRPSLKALSSLATILQ